MSEKMYTIEQIREALRKENFYPDHVIDNLQNGSLASFADKWARIDSDFFDPANTNGLEEVQEKSREQAHLIASYVSSEIGKLRDEVSREFGMIRREMKD